MVGGAPKTDRQLVVIRGMVSDALHTVASLGRFLVGVLLFAFDCRLSATASGLVLVVSVEPVPGLDGRRLVHRVSFRTIAQTHPSLHGHPQRASARPQPARDAST